MKNLERKTWKEFRATGLLWYINMILHAFGWGFVVSKDGDKYECYPVKTRFRGFTQESNTEGYVKVAKYLKEHGSSIYDDILENGDDEGDIE